MLEEKKTKSQYSSNILIDPSTWYGRVTAYYNLIKANAYRQVVFLIFNELEYLPLSYHTLILS